MGTAYFDIMGGYELCDREATAGDMIKFGEELVNQHGLNKVVFLKCFTGLNAIGK